MTLRRRLSKPVHRFSANHPLALALLILAAAGHPASAAELISNGSFASGIQHWAVDIAPTNGSLSCHHSAKNSGDAAAASGSLGCAFTAPGIVTVKGDCFALDLNETYIWRADVLLAGPAQPGFPQKSAEAGLVVSFSTDCTGPGAYYPIARATGGAPWARESLVFINAPIFGHPLPPQSAHAELSFFIASGANDGSAQAAWFDNISLQPASFDISAGPGCSMNKDRLMLCLNKQRFRVEGTFVTPQGPEPLHGVALTDDAGVFYFNNPQNLELNVKVLDACSFANRYWVFIAGSTNVGVSLSVTDLATGAVNTYTNEPETTFVTVTDTSAFACP